MAFGPGVNMTRKIPSAYAKGHDLESTAEKVVRWVCECGREFTSHVEWATHQAENGVKLQEHRHGGDDGTMHSGNYVECPLCRCPSCKQPWSAHRGIARYCPTQAPER